MIEPPIWHYTQTQIFPVHVWLLRVEASYSFVKISNFTRIRALSSLIPLKTGGFTVHHHHFEDFQHEDSRTSGKNNHINYFRQIQFWIRNRKIKNLKCHLEQSTDCGSGTTAEITFLSTQLFMIHAEK